MDRLFLVSAGSMEREPGENRRRNARLIPEDQRAEDDLIQLLTEMSALLLRTTRNSSSQTETD